MAGPELITIFRMGSSVLGLPVYAAILVVDLKHNMSRPPWGLGCEHELFVQLGCCGVEVLAPRVVLLCSGRTFRRWGLGEDLRSLVILRQKSGVKSEVQNPLHKSCKIHI